MRRGSWLANLNRAIAILGPAWLRGIRGVGRLGDGE
jgi:hypothetical protein